MTQNHHDQKTDALSLFNRTFDLKEDRKYHEAEEIYQHLLIHNKDNWYLHFNLGLLLLETNRSEEALNHFLSAVSLNSSSNDLYYHLALCQKSCGYNQPAVASYHRALELDPDDTESLYNLAACYHDLEQLEEAITTYKRLLRVVPDHQSALNNIAYILHKTGQFAKAKAYYKKLLIVNPAHASADHLFAALSGERRSTMPLSYIQEVFDSYSSVYERSLVDQLDYNLPKHLQALVAELSGKHLFRRILDLGCGTGLVGEVFNNSTATLDGVDLSSKMIAIAAGKGIYDQLVTADIESALDTFRDESYDLVLAADVFSYVGEIGEILGMTYRIGRPDCFFCFSVEDLDNHAADMVLLESGRFAHSNRYIKQAAVAAGWHLIHAETVKLRRERDGWITGAVYAMKKRIT